jgi:hypothetical protein
MGPTPRRRIGRYITHDMRVQRCQSARAVGSFETGLDPVDDWTQECE